MPKINVSEEQLGRHKLNNLRIKFKMQARKTIEIMKK